MRNRIPPAVSLVGDVPLAKDENRFFVSKARGIALDALTALSIGRLNHVTLAGIKGTGKTALVQHWLIEYSGAATIARIVADGRRPEAFLRQLAEALSLHIRSEISNDVIAHWRAALAVAFPTGRAAILIIDDADRLDLDTAETLKALAAIRDRGNVLLRVLTIGRPEVLNRFEPAQASRPGQNSGQVVLNNFDLAETGDFLRFLGQGGGKAPAFQAATAGNPGKIVEAILGRMSESDEMQAAIYPALIEVKRPRPRLFETPAERKKRNSLPVFDANNPRDFFRWGFGIEGSQDIEADEAPGHQIMPEIDEIIQSGSVPVREQVIQPVKQAPSMVVRGPDTSVAPIDVTETSVRALKPIVAKEKPREISPEQPPKVAAPLPDSVRLREVIVAKAKQPSESRLRWLGFVGAGAVALIAVAIFVRPSIETAEAPAVAPLTITKTEPADTAAVPPKSETLAPPAAVAAVVAEPVVQDIPPASVPADTPTPTAAPIATDATTNIAASNLPQSANLKLPDKTSEQAVKPNVPDSLAAAAPADPVPTPKTAAAIPPDDRFAAEGTDNVGYEETARASSTSTPRVKITAVGASLVAHLMAPTAMQDAQPADGNYVSLAGDLAAKTAGLIAQEQAALETSPTAPLVGGPADALQIEIAPFKRDSVAVDAALETAPGLGGLNEVQRADLATLLADGACVDQALREVTGKVNRHTLAALLHQMDLCPAL